MNYLIQKTNKEGDKVSLFVFNIAQNVTEGSEEWNIAIGDYDPKKIDLTSEKANELLQLVGVSNIEELNGKIVDAYTVDELTKLFKNKLLNYIATKKHLNLTLLCRDIGTNEKMLIKAVKELQPLPQKHYWSLCVELCKEGLEMGGWKFEYSTGSFFLSRRYYESEGAMPEEVIDNGTIEYRVSELRRYIEDLHELIEFIEGTE